MIYHKLKDIECLTCKKIFHPRYFSRIYCCWKCSKKQPKKCKFCGKEFIKYSRQNQKYCSRRCLFNAQKIGLSIRKDRTYLVCKNCGESFYGGNLKRKFCSNDCRNKYMKLEHHGSWQGGKSSEYDRFKQSKEYKLWRKKIFERNNYTCQKCRFRNGNGEHRDLHPHHIKSASKYPKLKLKINNGITLCLKCHGKEHSINFKNRKYKK